jgi:hypothetical protein
MGKATDLIVVGSQLLRLAVHARTLSVAASAAAFVVKMMERT